MESNLLKLMKKMEKAVITKEDLLEFLNYNELSAEKKEKYRDVDFEKLLEFADHDLIEVLETSDIAKDPRFKIEETKQIETRSEEEEERIVYEKRLKAQVAGKRENVDLSKKNILFDLSEKQISNTKRPTKIHLQFNYKCGACGKAFECKTYLARHEKIYQERCAYRTAKPKITGELECDQCGKKFKIFGQIRSHVRVHFQEQKFKCGTCSKTFKWKWNLIQHEKRHQINQKMIPCIYCQEEFASKRQLWKHYLSVHKDKRPFVCGKCGKDFKNHCGLIYHQNNHPY